MRIALLLLPLMVAAARRLSMDACSHSVYVLAQGAPLEKGMVIPMTRGYVSFRDDDTGKGTALVEQMLACQRETAFSIKVMPGGLDRAIAWLERECMSKECVVFSAVELPHMGLNFHVRV